MSVVFSTYVEMILAVSRDAESLGGVLHVCGDDPYKENNKMADIKCSPRMWR